jgi:hypothetical protein
MVLKMRHQYVFEEKRLCDAVLKAMLKDMSVGARWALLGYGNETKTTEEEKHNTETLFDKKNNNKRPEILMYQSIIPRKRCRGWNNKHILVLQGKGFISLVA